MRDWDIETRGVFIGENKRSAEGIAMIAMIAISARIAMNRFACAVRASLNTIHEFAEQAAAPLHRYIFLFLLRSLFLSVV
jgi:DMSO reductase anchor subunit